MVKKSLKITIFNAHVLSCNIFGLHVCIIIFVLHSSFPSLFFLFSSFFFDNNSFSSLILVLPPLEVCENRRAHIFALGYKITMHLDYRFSNARSREGPWRWIKETAQALQCPIVIIFFFASKDASANSK